MTEIIEDTFGDEVIRFTLRETDMVAVAVFEQYPAAVELEEFLAAIERELNVIVIDRADLPEVKWDENGKLVTGCEWAGSFDLRYWRVTALDALAALHYHERRTSLALAEALDTANIEAHPGEVKKLIELGVRVSNDD